MSSLFQEVKLVWDGNTVVVPADRVLPAIACVEEALTLHELQQFQNRGTIPMARLAQAYGALLRFAGVKVTDDRVYSRMLKADEGFHVGNAITGLLLMMLPKDITAEAVANAGKLQAGSASSKRRLK